MRDWIRWHLLRHLDDLRDSTRARALLLGDPAERRLGQQESDGGLARLTLEDERTVLSFWDRSVDRRSGAHSTFVLPPGLDFAAAVAAARTAFPAIWQRLDAAGVVVRLDAERFGGMRDRRGQ